nr:ASN_HP1_G0015800.mRNA.1.CDS.1 [Saccharomyces cerevisiae]
MVEIFERYSIPKRSVIHDHSGLRMVYLMLTGVIADNYTSLVCDYFTQVFNIIGNSILAAWDVARRSQMVCIYAAMFWLGYGSCLYSWQNDICRRDAQTQSFAVVTMELWLNHLPHG